jgi:hypothetical protein
MLMLIFTFAMFTGSFPSPITKAIWLTALVCWEWFAYNMVRASLDMSGLTYYRFNGSKHVEWDMIQSATSWKAAGGVVIRLKNRSWVSRYKFLLDSKPGMNVVLRDPDANDPTEIVLLREKLGTSLR